MGVAQPEQLASRLMAFLTGSLSLEEMAAVRRAVEIAFRAHEGQRRDDGTPYILHPLRAANTLVAELGIRKPDMICSVLLHDAVEDDESLSFDDIERLFGPRVASAVRVLTKPAREGRTRSEVNQEYFARLRRADQSVRVAKLVDRLDNVRDLPNCSDPGKQRRIADETRTFYSSLIGTLEERHLRGALEDAFARALALQDSGRST